VPRELELGEDNVPQDELDLAEELAEFLDHVGWCSECLTTLNETVEELVDTFATDEDEDEEE
jgi:hypothetical protein